jgi:L-lysine exporter family protein LysE/ArgO
MLMTFKFGLLLGFSIIISIGAQNLFVIQQAMRDEYTYITATVCFLSDFLLIVLGAAGVSALIIQFPVVKFTLLIFGVGFLGWYGVKALHRGIRGTMVSKAIDEEGVVATNSLLKIILLGLSFSLLNPAAIMDTVVIIGGNATHYAQMDRYVFLAGTITASLIWFFSLASIAKYSSRTVVGGMIWRALDIISGVLMMVLAISFLQQIG